MVVNCICTFDTCACYSGDSKRERETSESESTSETREKANGKYSSVSAITSVSCVACTVSCSCVELPRSKLDTKAKGDRWQDKKNGQCAC